MDFAGNRITLKDIVYIPESPDQILSLMKLCREWNANFQFTALEEFIILLPNDVTFSGKSVNDICYIWTSAPIHANAVITCNAFNKWKSLDEVNHGTENENENENKDENCTPDNLTNLMQIIPLICSPQDLWHLHFSHASTTTLCKHPYIKSNFDSTHCIICIQAKQTCKPFYPSESKITRKLEWIHSDLCGPFPMLKGKTIYILTFLDEYTHWCWVVTIADKSSSTVCKEYYNLIKQIEMESDLKIKYFVQIAAESIKAI